MTMTIEISPETQARLETKAAEKGQRPAEYLQAAVENWFSSRSADETAQEAARLDAEWNSLDALIERCQMDTGIPDLAHQHDHYIHGAPKRKE